MHFALCNGPVPLNARDADGKITMSLDNIWRNYWPSYFCLKLSSRLSGLRKIVERKKKQKFKEPGKWKTSQAYKLLKKAIRTGRVPTAENSVDWEELYLSHPEYA